MEEVGQPGSPYKAKHPVDAGSKVVPLSQICNLFWVSLPYMGSVESREG